MSNITIENVGAIKKVEIPIPEGGGVVVLRGTNGKGKSTALAAVDAAVRGKGGLSLRDGTEKGVVDACGVTLKVGKSTRASGKLAVETLEGRLSLADLVDPGLKSEVAADAKRVRALTQLAGGPIDIHDFEKAMRVEEFPDFELDPQEDALQMADRLKRHCEKIARDKESQSESFGKKAESLLAATGNVMTIATVDAESLAAATRDAAARHQELLRQREGAEFDARRREAIESKLAGLSEGFCGVEGLRETARSLAEEYEAKREECERLEAELSRSRGELKEAKQAHAIAVADVVNAEKTQGMLDELRRDLGTEWRSPPSEEAMAAAAKSLDAAMEAEVAGRDLSRRQEQAYEAAINASKAKELAAGAKKWRAIAENIASVLSFRIGSLGTPLRVDGERLVLDTARGQTFFADLSHGERWKLVIDIAVGLLGKQSLLTIPQEAWEGLAPANQLAIHEHAKERGVTIIAAQASDDSELVAKSL